MTCLSACMSHKSTPPAPVTGKACGPVDLSAYRWEIVGECKDADSESAKEHLEARVGVLGAVRPELDQQHHRGHRCHRQDKERIPHREVGEPCGAWEIEKERKRERETERKRNKEKERGRQGATQ